MTFFEIANLSEGRRILEMIAGGVTRGEEVMLNRVAEELANK